MAANPTAHEATQQPSLLSGHAKYAKGYVEETVGNATQSEEWKESGKQDTREGVGEMKAVSEQRKNQPMPSTAGGKVEELAGRATGCEGMEVEGKERQEKA